MMPECSKKKCRKIAEVYLGKAKLRLNDNWENPLYLCNKHAKQFIKDYGMGGDK